MKFFVFALSLFLYSNQVFAAFFDVSLPTASTRCSKTSPLIGTGFELSSLAHQVSGTVYVIDDCTIAVDDFIYDGKGLKVELYSAKGGDFTKGRALSIDLLSPTRPYQNDLLIFKLPRGQTVDTIEGLSVWCSDVGVSFGDVLFQK